jgi:hemerythrin-like domain-containing protein
MEFKVMASAAPTKPRSISAKRSAAAKDEPRDAHGRFKTAAARAKSASTDHSTRNAVLAGAAGLAVGLAANVARKFVVQAPTLLAGDWDEALKAEHALTRKVFDALEATTEANTTKRAALLMNLKHMLAKHALEEENVIYPALREAGEIEAADELTSEHGYVKQYLYELGEIPKESPLWIEKLRTFRGEIEHHMRDEEVGLFPRLKDKLSTEKNAELTKLMNAEGLKLA